jgi:hypothetical protein
MSNFTKVQNLQFQLEEFFCSLIVFQKKIVMESQQIFILYCLFQWL